MAALTAVLLFGSIAPDLARAEPFHQPTIDGVITADGVDWSPVDLVVDDTADETGGPRNVRRVWCTWDATSLYLGITYQDFSTGDRLAFYLDIDRGVGPNSAAVLDSFPANFRFPDDHAFELVLGRQKNLANDETPPMAVLVTDADGSVTNIDADVESAQTWGVDTRYPISNHAEFSLPWSVIYPGQGTTVPANAAIKAVAVITAGAADRNGWDSAPDNDGLDGGPAEVLLTNLYVSVIDADGDGTPDPADASISGTAVLPGDPGTGSVTVSAVLADWAGRELGGPLASVTTVDGERAWALPRLPAGSYEITTEIEGYFPDTVTVQVASGQQVTDIDQTLPPATGVYGTIGFASGSGGAGTISIFDDTETLVSTRDFTATGGDYVVWVQDSGNYTVRVMADTYLPDETPVTVTAGQDVTGIDFLLVRQTEISGEVAMVEGPGAAGMVYLQDDQGQVLDEMGFVDGGGPFEFFTPVGGTFTLRVDDFSPAYYVAIDSTVAVTAGQDLTGIVLTPPVAALVSGTMSFEGPDADGFLTITKTDGSARPDTMSFARQGDAFEFYMGPGEYRFEATATGYVPLDYLFMVAQDDLDLGAQNLIAVRATHLEMIDEDGALLEALATTVSTSALPDTQWFRTPVDLAARDDNGLDDLYDLDGNLTDFRLSARKLDDLSPPRGIPIFMASADLADTSTVVDFQEGRARFWIVNDAVEVLRVYLAQPGRDPIGGRIAIAFQDPKPTTVLLTTTADTLVADDMDRITITAKLYDSADNESKLAEIPVNFAVASGSSGSGRFDVGTVTTNGDGEAQGVLSATGAGLVKITCTVTVNNEVLGVEAYELNSGEEFLNIVALSGATVGWRLSTPSLQAPLDQPTTVTAQLIDGLGNPTRDEGETITFASDPPGLGSFDPVTALSDTNGRATSQFIPTGNAGLVTISGTGLLDGDEISVRLREVFVIPDPIWYEEPRTRQTFEPTDLTALVVDNTLDELILEIPYVSDWDGMQLHVLFETGFDAAGAARDPFEMPVNYGHTDRPDYALTTKYSANDYGDFRRWVGNGWEWWDPASESWGTSGSIQSEWVEKTGDGLTIRMPWAPFGSRPDSMRFEAYLTQEADGVKRSAFDSAPLDSTLNLTFDYEDPDPADWDIALGPVTLTDYGDVYRVKTDFPTPPTVSNVEASSIDLAAGQPFTLHALVVADEDGVGDVLADLSAVGAGELVRMYDDGEPSHGDVVADDSVYSVRAAVSTGASGGEQDLIVAGFDASNTSSGTDLVTVTVEANIEPILVWPNLGTYDPNFEGPAAGEWTGDDHGPNQSGTSNLYFTYPTNSAFVAGSFDLTDLTIYETTVTVSGTDVEMIAFQVGVVDFPDPADPGTANWNPLYADLNTTKIDILIDNAPGGATATLPNRQAAYQPWDAWDYAIILDGWYKAVIPSLGQNTIDAWRGNALRTDNDIQLMSSPVLNIVTALVSKEALGDPTPEDILGWDIAVSIGSHDFGGEEVLGGIRWVNESRSEWQFGGGQNEDRDPNLMDLMLIPGSGHSPGLAQEDILNYESPAALERLNNGETPVAIEMSAFEDTGPPVIEIPGDDIVTRVDPIEDAPLAMSLRITDDYRVENATFRYRATNYTGEGWDREVAMGNLGFDRWVVDILPSWLDSNLVHSPVDSSRYLEFEITASDPLGKTSTSPVTTLQITPDRPCRLQTQTFETMELGLLQLDGSFLAIEERQTTALLDSHFELAWTGGDVDPDTMGAAIELQWDICQSPEVTYGATAVPAGTPLGVYRDVYIATTDSLGGYLDYPGKLPDFVNLSLHYPQAWVPAGADENMIAMYEYHAESDRWVLLGGNVTPTGNNVTTMLDRTGTFGLFLTESLNYDPNEVISGVTISPNPFSPNSDGLYDETTISFFLNQEASVTVEIYNIEGRRKKTLLGNYTYSGTDQDRTPRRIAGLVWDGTDFNGEKVPYGIYITRILVTYNQAGGTRTLRSNHSVAVIR